MKKPNNQEKNQSEKDKKHFSKLIEMKCPQKEMDIFI